MDFAFRIKMLQNKLDEFGIDILRIIHPIDLRYLTGINLSTGSLYITKDEATLLVDGRYIEVAEMRAPCKVCLSTKNQEVEIVKNKKVVIGFDASAETVSGLSEYKKKVYPVRKLLKYKALFQPVASQRACKDSREIKKIKNSCELCVEGFLYIKQFLKLGVSEKEISDLLKIFWLKNGADDCSFEPIIAFGKNSSMPHYRTGKRVLKKGDLVLVDIGVILDGYHSDMTRMLSYGCRNNKLLDMVASVYEAQQEAIKSAIPKVPLCRLDQVARNSLAKQGYGPNFVHSLGHGIGLETHEWPILRASAPQDDLLQEGMCITIEPGAYIPNMGGARIEDTVVITKTCAKVLTSCESNLIELL